MLGATVSTCKASCSSQINDWRPWRQWALVKPFGCSQLHDLCLWRQSALAKHPCFRSYMIDVCGDSELSPQTSIMELRTMNVLQVLAVATSINHGAAKKINMLYKCSLSPWSSIMELKKKLDALRELAVAPIINPGAAAPWFLYSRSGSSSRYRVDVYCDIQHV